MHNPKPNANELLHENAQEANYLREKRLYEKNSRLKEEQTGLDRLNREIEDENRIRNSRKAQLRNEQYQEYTNYLKQKYEDNSNQKSRKNQLTEKIGGENRQIVRKNYDEANNGLCLNPTREVMDRRNVNSIQQTPTQQRNASHGYNIINNQIMNESSKYQTGANLQQVQRNYQMSDPRVNEYQNSGNRDKESSLYEQQYLQQQQYQQQQQQQQQQRLPPQREQNSGDYYQDQMNQHNMEHIEPLKSNPYQNQMQMQSQQQEKEKEKEPELTEEDYKRYYEYLNSLRKNENSNENMSANNNMNNINSNPYNNDYQPQSQQPQRELGNNMNSRDQDPYANYMSKPQPQINNQINELENQMHQLSLQEEARNEYLANKQKNRSSFSNLTDNTSSQQQQQQQKQLDTNNPNSLKQDKQRMYREYLDSQIKAKDVYKQTLNTLTTYGSGSLEQNSQNIPPNQITPQNLQVQSNPYKAMREKNSKLNDIPSNPYSNKNYNFGSSALSNSNPITNPGNSYKFQSGDNNRQVGSGRLRNLGSNITNQ